MIHIWMDTCALFDVAECLYGKKGDYQNFMAFFVLNDKTTNFQFHYSEMVMREYQNNIDTIKTRIKGEYEKYQVSHVGFSVFDLHTTGNPQGLSHSLLKATEIHRFIDNLPFVALKPPSCSHPVTPKNLADGYARSLDRKPPAHKKSSVNDCILWEQVKDFAVTLSTGDVLYFVTSNTTDFNLKISDFKDEAKASNIRVVENLTPIYRDQVRGIVEQDYTSLL